MSSGFVSGGTIAGPAERDDEWKKAQQEIEERHRAKVQEGQQEGGKSLYEVLQANKAAKQEAFEESIRLKNQFRSLNEDEVEFLDSVLESTRAKEAAIRKETSEQLDVFRKQQEEAEKASLARSPDNVSLEEEDTWVVNSRKRKRAREKESLRGIKARNTSTSGDLSKPEGGTPPSSEKKASVSLEVKESKSTQQPKVDASAVRERSLPKDPPCEKGSNGPNTSGNPKGTASTITKCVPPAGKPAGLANLGLNYSSDEDD
ncbi:N-terminal domain of NEFA-interacting nuclear protein NIP30-domain-containing protein [Lineolata rhizophorae]|uniref:N-terminal domain of NEFA-interacting nuclear protein NIP30-domain-containing protein n=1 Tax=Lineolata rhizophorae TaxID=578093 RepID=A0A6A6PBW0_9PEZI|nr:N-terminal domain of NEFA-interacting nuclear protein NIP30-domain-containing protein [Lineolata rhizophorae]